MKNPASLLLVLLLSPALFAADSAPLPPRIEKAGIPYLEGDALQTADDYRREQCQLDLSLPAGNTGFATVIWFHGGGLTGGKRSTPALPDKSLGVVGVGYRLSPKADHPAYLRDAAAATAWVLKHIAEYGGDPKKVFVSGHSAGGWLAAMIGMDPRWLKAEGVSNRDLAGIIPVSGQMTTHFHVKKLLGDTGPELRPIINEWAPLFYASKDLPPICLILGERSLELKNRVVENDLLATSLRNLGHPLVEFHEMDGLDHGTVIPSALNITPEFVHRVLEPAQSK